MSSTGPQDSPVWPPVPQDRADPPPGSAPVPAPTPASAARAPAPPTRRGRRARRFSVAAVGAVVLATAGTAVALNASPRVEQRQVYTHLVSAIDVETGSGDVTVRTGASPGTVEVIRRFRGDRNATPGGASWQDTTLSIRPDCSTVCDIDYEILVPETSPSVTVKTGSGDVQLSGALGNLTLQSGSGDLEGSVSADSVTTVTGSGDQDLVLTSAPTQLSVQSGSGDIDLQVPASAAYSVTRESGSGDVDVDVPDQPNASHRLVLRTGSGDISVTSR